MELSYRHTRAACYLGHIAQAIVNNLSPLLFLTFQREFSISLERLALLISINFMVQLAVDFAAVHYADRIGYRKIAVAAHVCCTAGLVAMGVLPYLLPSAYAGLLLATGICAVGGGLIEVIISPIIQSLPSDHKAASMSLLHSFYCWGHVGVVLLSTLYFLLFGIQQWRFLPILWAALPLFNTVLFALVPICSLVGEEHAHGPVKGLLGNGLFRLFFVLVLCAGASEQAMVQWASFFAEAGLGVSKAMGDLLGPCAFAVLMGSMRLFYGIYGSRLDLEKTLVFSGGLCVVSYLVTVFSPVPLLSLLGCAVCGLSVGMLWPGTFSLAARRNPQGGTAMFAMLSVAGDLGCTAGPGLVGLISGSVQRAWGTLWGLKVGLFFALLFPAALLAGMLILRRRVAQTPQES